MIATRFPTMRDLFEEFPSLKNSTKAMADEAEPLAIVSKLAQSGRGREAVAICAFLLRKREAVWWACQCLRLRPVLALPDDQALRAAEHWARSPSEEARDVAAKWGAAGDQTAPSTWVAHAAGFSGGSVGTGVEGPIRAPAHLTAESARCALLLAEPKLEQKDIPAFQQACVDAAMALLTAPQAGR